jgi:hypothetical protein
MLTSVRWFDIFRVNFDLSGTFRAEGLPLQRARVRDRPVGSRWDHERRSYRVPAAPFSAFFLRHCNCHHRWNAWRFFRLLLPSESPSNTLRYTTHRQTSAVVGAVRMVMAAILAPGVLRMVKLPRRPHPHNRPHRPVAKGPQ